MPTPSSIQSFFLPPFAKMVTLPDGSVIQRGLLNFIIRLIFRILYYLSILTSNRSATGRAMPINPIPSYIPTAQRPSKPLSFITKRGPFSKMSFLDGNVWLRGELKMKGIEISWEVENEGEGRARMDAGSGIKLLDKV